jgi:pimeloyl-ACP methyl ester carboxylesterase
MRDLIHFVHGNGFPSPCYRQFLSQLETRFDCSYIDQVGHNDNFTVSDNWPFLVHEVIASIQRQSHSPVIAVGHSLGGVLSLLASIEKPELFKAVILLDSPLFGPIKSSMLRISKCFGFVDKVTPAGRTNRRRTHWRSREEAMSYLKHRSLFKNFTNVCSNDYIDYGMKHDASGYSLGFQRNIEYQIFRTMPHTLSQYEGRLQVPAALIYGKQSTVINRFDLHHMKKHYGIVNYAMDGSHMFPMEHPLNAANLVLQVIDDLSISSIPIV